MNKAIELIRNVGLLTLGQFGSKILNILLVPLYTYALSTQEYGSYDLIVTTVNLLIPILTLNIYDGAGRYSIGNGFDRSQVLSVAIKWLFIGCSLCVVFGVCAFLGVNAFGLRDYWAYFIVIFALTALSGVLTIYIRGLELFRTIAISGVLSTLVIIALNLLFLLYLGLGLDGYFLANILGLLFQCIYIIISGKLWRYLTYPLDKPIERRMLKYSTPMIANTVSWWVNDLSDRIIVTLMCGIAANGIYSIAYKIPAIMNMMSSVFSQAWTLSAVRDFDSEDKDGFFSSAYALYLCLMAIACSLLITLDKPIAGLLFSNEFFDAWAYVPFLLIASVFGGLSGYMGAFFTAMEDAKSFAKTSITGACANVVLTVALVPFFGPLGAAFATAFSGFVIWAMRILIVREMMSVDFAMRRDAVVIILLIVQAVLLILIAEDGWFLYCVEAALTCIIAFLFRSEIKRCASFVLKRVHKSDEACD